MKNNVRKISNMLVFFVLMGSVFSLIPLVSANETIGEPIRVTYDSGGYTLVGHLYLPEGYVEGEQYPAIVVTRPASGVKEQTAGVYAQNLSTKGFVTIAFDPKGYGESEGRPQNEDAFSVISDSRNTLEYMLTRPEVDPDNLFHMGICMGSGYATAAASGDSRIKGVATVSPIVMEPMFDRMPLRRFFRLLNLITDITGRNFLMQIIPEGGDLIIDLLGIDNIAIGMREYYLPGMPGGVPNWKNQMNLYSFETTMTLYNAFEYIDDYEGNAFFMAYGTQGYYLDQTQAYYDAINAEEKELMTFDAGHFELYWKPEYVNPITEGIATLFHNQIE
jgi:hypothetical protein